MLKLNATAVSSFAALVISIATLVGCKSTDAMEAPANGGADTAAAPATDTTAEPTDTATVPTLPTVPTVPTSLPTPTIRQITFGPNQHFYGYQGHAGNTPFNHSGTKLALLEVSFQDRLVTAGDVANVVLVDVATAQSQVLTGIRAWNFQQGTMMYWNPLKPDEELFFNDRTSDGSNKIETVLFNVNTGTRREFFFPDTPFGNSGVAQNGGKFLGINYGRLQRLRPITGYAGAYDWTVGVDAPTNDGIFLVDVESGASKLLVSFKDLLDKFVGQHPEMAGKELLINHTLWNRTDTRIIAAVRWLDSTTLSTVWFTMNPDGTDVRETPRPGHFDWELGQKVVGWYGTDVELYDTEVNQPVQVIAPGFFTADGDVAIARDLNWIATFAGPATNRTIKVYSRAAQVGFEMPGFDASPYVGDGTTGPNESYTSQNRLDGSPLWSPDVTKIYQTRMASDGTRQGFVIDLKWP
jgi:hypothetical protein